MAAGVTQTEVEPTCSICLGEFSIPRQLPCAHSFCQSCLQSYITSKATEHEKKRCIECPVCRQATGHFKENKSTSDWASVFPIDTVLHSMLTSKSKVDRVCDACNSDGISVTATGFCAVCEEAMCDDCQKFHRKQKISKSHTILVNEDLLNDLGHLMKFADGFTCFEHSEKDLEFYCNTHKIACCGICFLESHKTCPNVQMLKDELPTLLRDTKMSEMIEQLKKLESDLKTFIDRKETNMNDIESQINGLSDEMKEMRKKMNTAMDELEMKVMMEGRRLHIEVVIKTQEETHQCLSLVHAIRNSQLVCETVNKYGTDTQKVLTAEKIKSQLPLYCSQVTEKYKKTDTMRLEEQFSPLFESILSPISSDAGKLVCLRKDSKECQMGQMFQTGYTEPTVPHAAQRGFFTPHTMTQMSAGHRWPTVTPNQASAQTGGFQNMPVEPQIRPARPTGTAQTSIRPSDNVRAITGQNTTQPQTGMPVTQSNVSGCSAPARVPSQQRGIYNMSQQSPSNNFPQAQKQQAVAVHSQEPLTSHMLASAPPEEQKQMLGERLFPLIQNMYPDLAGKITGMLLEIDNLELLHMLGPSESLKAKVVEAVAVLHAHQAKESASKEKLKKRTVRSDAI